MKISIVVTTKNEFNYIEPLFKQLKHLLDTTEKDFEVVILDDYSDDNRVIDLMDEYSSVFTISYHHLNNDFATHKNEINQYCKGSWIIQLDADECMTDELINSLHDIIEDNPTIESYFIPRINTVDGITLEYVNKWNWSITKLDWWVTKKEMHISSDEYKLLKTYNLIINESVDKDFYEVSYYEPIICWPDYQMRLYKNSEDIKWVNKVHERLTGYAICSSFPIDPSFSIIHKKEINRQIKQNNYYDTIVR